MTKLVTAQLPANSSQPITEYVRPSQVELYPLEITATLPRNPTSACLTAWVVAEDGQYYCIKDQSRDPLLPCSEWVCSRLAQACHIAVPEFKRLRTERGLYVFGSRQESGVVEQLDAPTFLKALKGEFEVDGLASRLSAFYAFDIFIHNTDRHFGNYLLRCVGRKYVLMSIDFSHAFLYHGLPPADVLLPSESLTVKVYRKVEIYQPFSLDVALGCLNKIKSLPADFMDGIFYEMPLSWIDDSLKQKLRAWWSGPARSQRVSAIERGLINGALF